MTGPERDDEISRRYRALEREEPPHALDEEILSAARGAVETHPAPLVAPTARRRWYVPLAAVAVIVLSVVVTLQMQRAPSDGELMVPPAPSPPAVQEGAAPVAPPAAAVPKAEVLRDQAAAKTERRFMAAAPKPAPSPVQKRSVAPSPQQPTEKPFPGAAEAERGAEAASAGAAAPQERREPRPAVAADRVGRMAAEAVSRRADEAESPERLLQRIVTLRREGRAKEADELYAEFRRRYPEYRIPDAMREQVLPRR